MAGCKPNGGNVPQGEKPPPAVTVAQPIRRTVVEWDEFTGRLAAVESVEIRARVSGYLDTVHFKEGADVELDELLFTIDPRPYEAIVQRMEAQLSSARSRAALAAQEAKNVSSLRDSQAISAEAYERRIKSAAEAESEARAAEADLRSTQLDLEFTQIRSPIAGRVSDARVTKGNLVTGGTKDATLLTTVVSLDPIYCQLEVDERSALKYRALFREGKRSSASFDKLEAEMGLANETGFPHKGFLDFGDNELDPTSGTIRARAVFPNPDKLMAPGFFARVRIPGSGQFEGLLIQDRAIADDQGRSFVWVLDQEDQAVYRPIVTGPLLDGLRVVREGLSPDDRVVINGMMSVKNGIKVNPQIGEMTPVGAK
jgi:RND family efflux transporter MFP subunit